MPLVARGANTAAATDASKAIGGVVAIESGEGIGGVVAGEVVSILRSGRLGQGPLWSGEAVDGVDGTVAPMAVSMIRDATRGPAGPPLARPRGDGYDRPHAF